jgi:hypothetical protein
MGLSAHPVQFSPHQLREEAEKLRLGLRRRSIVGSGAAWIVIAAWTIFFFIFHNTLQRIGSIVTVVGTSYMLVQLRKRRGSAMPNLGETDCVRFYRVELERQRDVHQGIWLWSRLAFFMPGPVIWMVGFAQAYPKIAPFIWIELAAFVILAASAARGNLRLAQKYQHRINALDATGQAGE